MLQIIVNLFRGVAVGLANIIPGVSGGTMALVLGIYGRLIAALHNIGPRTFLAPFRGLKALRAELARIDALFLATLGFGAVAAVVAMAKALTYLLHHQHDPTYGFFFGLVLVSVVVPWRMIRRRSFGALVAALAAVALVVGLANAMSGEERLAAERKKAAIKAAGKAGKAQAAQATGAAAAGETVPQVEQDAKTLLFFFAAGAIAISAMILPGISGSFILLLMGIYFELLACIVNRQLLPLGVFALGCLVGLLLFTRVLNFLLERAHDLTMAFLLGLVVGSLYAIWPFRSAGDAPALPASFGGNEVATVLTAVVGAAIVAAFIWLEQRMAARKAAATAEAS